MRAEFIPQVCNTLRVVLLHGFGGMASTLTVKSLWRHTFSQRHFALYRLPLFFAGFLIIQDEQKLSMVIFTSCGSRMGRNRDYFNIRQIAAGLSWRLQGLIQGRPEPHGAVTDRQLRTIHAA